MNVERYARGLLQPVDAGKLTTFESAQPPSGRGENRSRIVVAQLDCVRVAIRCVPVVISGDNNTLVVDADDDASQNAAAAALCQAVALSSKSSFVHTAGIRRPLSRS